MRTREYTLIVLSCVIATVCVRLGIWQLRRLHERRVHNAAVVAQLIASPIPVMRLSRDSMSLHYRRALLHGAYDYAHEIVLSSRTRNGSPGVNIVTPMRLPGTDSAVLVNRGWIYSPDGVHTDLSRWHEGDSVNSVGYTEPLGKTGMGVPRSPTRPNAYRWIDHTVLQQAFPYPVLPFIVVLQGDTTPRATVPPRVPPPPLDEGPHASYAIQWFSFAAIAIVGTLFFVRRTPLRPQPVSRHADG